MHVNHADANMQANYKLWKEQVRRIDNLLTQMYAEIQDVMKRSRNANRSTTPSVDPARKSSVPTVLWSKSGNTKPLILTAKEKILLMKYHSCFKCCRFDQKH